MADRRAKGLCMFCDEVFTPGHQLKHKRTQLLVMELEEEEPINEEVEFNADKDSVSVECAQFECPQLSMNALTGISSYQTMRVSGLHNKKLLQILVDSGSTHNFLDLEMAKKLGCQLEAIPSMTVTAGGGTKLQAPFVCKGFTWHLQQTKFSADVLVLPLGCCDLILGIQWLTSLGPILWDFNKLQMEFSMEGKKFVLRGAKTAGVKLINNKSFSQAVQQGAQMCFLYLDKPENYVEMPSCNMLVTCSVLQQQNTEFLRKLRNSLNITMTFLLNQLSYPLLDLGLTTGFLLKRGQLHVI